MRKFLILTVVCMLFLTACGRQGSPDKAEMTTVTPATQTEAAVTKPSQSTVATSNLSDEATVRAWDGPFKTDEIKIFFERHQQTMLELATVLVEHDVKSLNISSGIYDGDPIPEKLKPAFFTFASLMEAETNAEHQIAMGTIDGKRVISFCFTMYHAENGDATIMYMPDGYFQAADIDYSNETKLAEHWYGYWS